MKASTLALCAFAAALYSAGCSAAVLVPKDPAYVKECGACHMPFSPQLLPAASWRRVMAHLDDHFGDNAALAAPSAQAITEYLVANAADHAQGGESRAIVQSIGPGEVPARIMDVPYLGGLHAAVMDPAWRGQPRPKRLSECGACHVRADRGDFGMQAFTVTDEGFRGK